MARTIRRRRMEAKTDYKARLEMIKSGKPRLVVRKTNKYMIAQIVKDNQAQDSVIVGASSKDLLGKGWPKDKTGSLKNRAASYLTGFILGKMAKEKKISECILDAGMYRSIKKSRIYSVLKGAIDSGLKIPHSAEALPSDDLISVKGEYKKIIETIKGAK